MIGTGIDDCWVNFELRPFADITAAVSDEPDGECPVILTRVFPDQVGGYYCLRADGHPGRHIAVSFTGTCAAWPGTLPPTLADLEATP